MLWRHNLQSGCSAVGSASGLGPECREFESLHSDHIKPLKLLGFSGFYFYLTLVGVTIITTVRFEIFSIFRILIIHFNVYKQKRLLIHICDVNSLFQIYKKNRTSASTDPLKMIKSFLCYKIIICVFLKKSTFFQKIFLVLWFVIKNIYNFQHKFICRNN